MKIAIMQPYFLPYIGYFQLIAAVDVFVLYDNIQYTKKGFINRNYMLQNDRRVVFTLPLTADSDYSEVCNRALAVDFNRVKLLNRFKENYRRAPYFAKIFALLEDIVYYECHNLFQFLRHSIEKICAYLGIGTEVRISSGIAIDHTSKNQNKVLAICEAVGANIYVNSIGGMALYSAKLFKNRGVDLRFLSPKPFAYTQFDADFVPLLSIVDVLMFNSRGSIEMHIAEGYELVENTAVN